MFKIILNNYYRIRKNNQVKFSWIEKTMLIVITALIMFFIVFEILENWSVAICLLILIVVCSSILILILNRNIVPRDAEKRNMQRIKDLEELLKNRKLIVIVVTELAC